MNGTRPFRAALTASLLLLAACAGAPVEIVPLQNDMPANADPYERLLVVGVAATGPQRRELEDLVTSQLRAADITAIASHSVTGVSPVIEQAAVDAAAQSTASDAILVAHIDSTRVTAKKDPGRVEVMSVCRGGNPVDAFLYEHKELREPDTVSLAHEIVIISTLYDVESRSRIWMIQSTCFDTTGFDDVLAREARAIVRQLRRDGLVAAAGR